MASGSIVIPELRGSGVSPPPQKLCSLKSTLTALFEIQTCGRTCRALTLFSQSLLLQLMEGYFWQSPSCPFPCTLALIAAVIVPALSKYLGSAWRNQTSEPCTQVACNSPPFKCNYPSSVVFLCFALCCQEWRVYSVQSKAPLRGSEPSQTEMADIVVDSLPPSTPRCVSWCCLSSRCLYCLASCYTGRPRLLKKLSYYTLFTVVCPWIFSLENNETFCMGVRRPF